MTLHDEVHVAVGSEPSVAAPTSGSASFGSFRMLQFVLFGLTVAGVVIGWRVAVPGGIAPTIAVAFGLTLAWALVGVVDTRVRERAGQGLTVPPPGRGRRPGGRRRAGCRPQSRPAPRLGRRPRRRHTRGPSRDGHFVSLPPCLARRATPRFRATRHGGHGLRGGDRHRARVSPGRPGLQPGRRRDQLVHRRRPRDRADAQPLHRVYRASPRADGMVRNRGVPGGDGRAGGDGVAPAGGLACAARRRHCRSNRPRPTRPAGRGEQEARAAREQGPGPGARRVRVRRGGVSDLPGGRSRSRSCTEDDG